MEKAVWRMLRIMRPHHVDHEARKQKLAEERRLQTAAALLLGLVVLVAIVLRAGVGNIFTPGWWRH